MSNLLRILKLRVASEATVVRVAQFGCFATAPSLLLLALVALPRFATTRFEFFLGVLASSAVALLLVVMGLVLPVGLRKQVEDEK